MTRRPPDPEDPSAPTVPAEIDPPALSPQAIPEHAGYGKRVETH
jgi:hypothetical protein